jgi:predicted nucleotidyltransferase component of viral defense system
MEFTEIRRLTIIGLFSDDALFEQLVLKGGNAISLVYEFGGRASLDLDFSIEEDFKDVQDAERRILRALERKFGEHGILLFDGKFAPKPEVTKPEVPWWGGYQFEFKIIEKSKYAKLGGNLDAIRRNSVVVGPRQERRFRVDFSKYEYCAGKVERELDDYTIYVYTPEMIVMEKLRAICQQMPAYTLNVNKRGRARDFYDIHLLVTTSNLDLTTPEHIALLRGIFSIKEVPVELLRQIAGQHESHRQDWAAVKDAVAGQIEEFEFYFEFVLREVRGILESLGVK